MTKYLLNRYIYGIIDHPFDLIELTIRIWIFIVTLTMILLSFNSGTIFNYQLIRWFLCSLIFFFIHLICKRISPHRFHFPHVKSLNIPLAEKIRSSTLYLFISSVYLANFSLNTLGFIPNLNTLTFWDWFSKVINFITVAVFLSVLLVYIGTLGSALKRIPLTFLLSDLFILGSICVYFVYLLITDSSFQIAVESFGKFLLGSITLMIARDLFIGKWTHDLPFENK